MAARGRATGRPGRPGARNDAATGRSGTPQRPPTGGPTSGDLAAHRARLRSIIEPVARSAGYDLEDLSVVRMGRRFVVRVTVDRDGGVGLDAVADLSRAISTALDDAEATSGEFIAGEYQLEVSSPGVDRPLTAPRHWRRNIGRLVTVPVDGRKVTGRVVAADDESVTLLVDGVEQRHARGALGHGRVEVEFARLDEVDDEDMVAFDVEGDSDAATFDLDGDDPGYEDDEPDDGDEEDER
jgi:ribosome maturation factor RimP